MLYIYINIISASQKHTHERHNMTQYFCITSDNLFLAYS